MENIIRQSIVSLVTGLAFMLGIGIVAIIIQRTMFPSPTEWFMHNPKEIILKNVSKEESSPEFSVKGLIVNAGENNWNSVGVKMIIYAEEAQVNKCEKRIFKVKRNTEVPFGITCKNVSGVNLPDNISYKVTITGAWSKENT